MALLSAVLLRSSVALGGVGTVRVVVGAVGGTDVDVV